MPYWSLHANDNKRLFCHLLTPVCLIMSLLVNTSAGLFDTFMYYSLTRWNNNIDPAL